MWALSGEERGEPGSRGRREARALLCLPKGTWKWSVQSGSMPVSRTPQAASGSPSLQSLPIPTVGILPGPSPQEVVEAALQLSAAEERGTWPGPVAKPLPREGSPPRKMRVWSL